MVEGQFVLKGVTRDDLKFYRVLGSLQENAECSLGDLMHGPPPATCYYCTEYVALVPGWVTICGSVASLVMALGVFGASLVTFLAP
jgi:hypothetical protein